MVIATFYLRDPIMRARGRIGGGREDNWARRTATGGFNPLGVPLPAQHVPIWRLELWRCYHPVYKQHSLPWIICDWQNRVVIKSDSNGNLHIISTVFQPFLSDRYEKKKKFPEYNIDVLTQSSFWTWHISILSHWALRGPSDYDPSPHFSTWKENRPNFRTVR